MNERIDFDALAVQALGQPGQGIFDLDGTAVDLRKLFDKRLLLICLRHLA